MRELRHPLSGSLYGLAEDGLVRVEKDGRWGLFRADGRWVSGPLRSADPHLCNWLASQPRPRRRAGAPAAPTSDTAGAATDAAGGGRSR